jgi:hypothetical protein
MKEMLVDGWGTVALARWLALVVDLGVWARGTGRSSMRTEPRALGQARGELGTGLRARGRVVELAITRVRALDRAQGLSLGAERAEQTREFSGWEPKIGLVDASQTEGS